MIFNIEPPSLLIVFMLVVADFEEKLRDVGRDEVGVFISEIALIGDWLLKLY